MLARILEKNQGLDKNTSLQPFPETTLVRRQPSKKMIYSEFIAWKFGENWGT